MESRKDARLLCSSTETLSRTRADGIEPDGKACTDFHSRNEPQEPGSRSLWKPQRLHPMGRGARSEQTDTRRRSVGVSLLEVRKTQVHKSVNTEISREKQNCPISTQTTQQMLLERDPGGAGAQQGGASL